MKKEEAKYWIGERFNVRFILIGKTFNVRFILIGKTS